MVRSRLKLHMVLSPDTIECGNKEKKPQLTQLPAFSLGQEDSSTEPNSMKTKNSNTSATLSRQVSSNASRKDL